MTLKQLKAQIFALCTQNDTQAATIKRQWMEISNLSKERDYWRREAERQANRKPTREEIHEEIFGGHE
ncbi:hypothetical protein [Ruegeria sp. HKCCA4812]|uniref:hypothetical protein n=1 Tax=Ruegeria sp. HKCCA4812 TaxID=2682993 RepID=UPI001489DBCE|nr:hypothetical protein [Ruegeria sp. HKCCA4812]